MSAPLPDIVLPAKARKIVYASFAGVWAGFDVASHTFSQIGNGAPPHWFEVAWNDYQYVLGLPLVLALLNVPGTLGQLFTKGEQHTGEPSTPVDQAEEPQ